MSSLTFHALSVYRHEEYGRPSTEFPLRAEEERKSETPNRQTSITIGITPDPETRVELATGEVFREMQGSLTLRPADETHPIASADKNQNQIGFIQYLEAYTSDTFVTKAWYALWALIPRSQFDDLATELHNSRLPLSIDVDIEGLELPDEFSHKWDNNVKKHLPMVSVKFSLPVAYFSRIDTEDKEQLAGLMPVTRAEIITILEKTVQHAQKLNTKLTWVTWLLVAIAVLLVIRFL